MSSKDENGNTDLEASEKFYEARLLEKKKSKSGSAVDQDLMNYPRKPSDMFLNKGNSRFAVTELKRIYAKLLRDQKLLDLSYKGFFGMSADGRPVWESYADARPIREFPFRGVSRADPPFRSWLEQYELTELVEAGRFYPTNRHAVAAFRDDQARVGAKA